MPRHRFTVELQGKYHNVDPDILEDILYTRFEQQLKRRAWLIEQCDLNLIVIACDIEPLTSHAFFKGRLDGQLNRKSLSKVFRRQRGKGASGVGGAVAMAALNATMKVFRGREHSPFGLGLGGANLEDCIDDCMASIEIVLDQTLNISESQFSNRWKVIMWMRWCIPSAVVVLNLVIPIVQGKSLGLHVAAAAMYSLSLYMLVWSSGYLIMPATFFTNDPRGRLAMSRSGVKSILAMRILCVILILILTTASISMILLSHVDDGKKVEPVHFQN